MDIKDVRVLFQAGYRYYGPGSLENRRPNFERIGLETGLGASEVENGIMLLEELKLINGYIAIPNVHLVLGRKLRTYLLPFPDALSKGDVVADLKLVNDIIRIDEYLNSVAFTIMYKSNLDVQQSLSRIAKLTGNAMLSEEPLLLQEAESGAPGEQGIVRDLLPIDWDVIKSLRYDALKPLENVAKDIGAHVPTAKESLSRLVDSELLFVIPTFDEQKFSELTLFALLFIPDGSMANIELLKRLTDAFRADTYYTILSPSGAIIFLMFAKDAQDANASYLKAQKMLGVKVVLIDFAGKTYHSLKSIDQIIEKNASKI